MNVICYCTAFSKLFIVKDLTSVFILSLSKFIKILLLIFDLTGDKVVLFK